MQTTNKETDWSFICPCSYPGLAGNSYVSHEQLQFLISRLPEEGRYLEIGTASGVTAALIADARPKLQIICADTFDGGMDHWEGDRLANWRHNKRDNMHLWFAAVYTMLELINPGRVFDAAFVDANHDFECTLACLWEASQLVRDDGIIMAHDWDDPHWPDVAPAGEQFCRDAGWHIADGFSTIRVLRKSS